MATDKTSAPSKTVHLSQHKGETHSFPFTPEDCQHVDDCANASLERLYQTFSASARRWELIVYPSLFMFVILAAYGFYLIYSLTKDAHVMAEQMVTITSNMSNISRGMLTVSGEMGTVATEMRAMNTEVATASASTEQMVANMQAMNGSMAAMTGSIDHMRYSMAVMNNSVSRPMSFMNSFMPW